MQAGFRKGRSTVEKYSIVDIELLVGTPDEFQELTNLQANSATIYGMDISAEKSKVVVDSNDTSINSNITLKGNKLEEVNRLCYLAATLLIMCLMIQKLR